MAQHDKVALRYARAAFEALGDKAQQLKAVEALRAVGTLLEENPELRLALTSEIFSESDRWAVLEGLSQKAKFDASSMKVFRVLNEAKRLAACGAVGEKLRTLVLHGESIFPIRVESATELNADQRAQVEKRFTELLGNKVEAEYVLSPQVLGGLRVDAEGRTYNGTVAGWLESFEEKLVGG